jgi:excisionase family DNA binding protein
VIDPPPHRRGVEDRDSNISPITQRDGVVIVSGAAVPLMYRAVLALTIRHRRDGVSSPPLLHTLRTVLFRAATSPPRHRLAETTLAETSCDGQVPSDWCSTGEASFLLGVSRRQVQRMAAEHGRGGLDAIRVGRTWLLPRAPVLALARERQAASNDRWAHRIPVELARRTKPSGRTGHAE